ncbi:MAG: 16S rRNA (cytidine(1402)-2'-O)-methyltransferase [Hyphomonadaceae bacterium]|jgi:16S rRNA (cytidine1402-2'-O)-methyltransferase|nr:16S rRNA (cytidine(1402)-2'-O)-methyltransferase [Hyphomonadaceae bacterium]
MPDTDPDGLDPNGFDSGMQLEWSGASLRAQRVDPGLWLVATPIGNLADMPPRGLEVLRRADLILAEDTRVARRLLSAFGLGGRLERCDEAATAQGFAVALPVLLAGGIVAFVADAGSPGVSDPGARLAELVLDAGHGVFATPGPSAALVGLAMSGLAGQHFFFAGFAPAKSGTRKTFLQDLATIPATLILFETGPRLADSLADMASVLGDRRACVARELTKLHEEARHGRLIELAAHYAKAGAPRGEIVLVVEAPARKVAAASGDSADIDRLLSIALAEGVSVRQAAAMAAAMFNVPRRVVYSRAQALKDAS